MRSIWMSRLGRASTILAIAGLAIVATGAGAEARNDGYWDHWGYHRYYGNPWWSHGYYYGYAPPAVAYTDPYYYGPSFSLTIP